MRALSQMWLLPYWLAFMNPVRSPGGGGGAEGLVLGARFPKPDAQPSAGAYERQEQ